MHVNPFQLLGGHLRKTLPNPEVVFDEAQAVLSAHVFSRRGGQGLHELVGLAGVPVAGDLLYWGASGWARLAKGSASQEIRMNAGATAPEWYTPSAASEAAANNVLRFERFA